MDFFSTVIRHELTLLTASTTSPSAERTTRDGAALRQLFEHRIDEITSGHQAGVQYLEIEPCLQLVAPDNRDVGVMLPYAPLHHLLFAAGAPDLLVMTSAR